MATQIPDYSSMAEGSTALASARMSTRAAPARFSTLAQASAVAPVVITSSTTTMRFSRNAALRRRHPERSGDVLAPLRRREPDLARGALDPGEQEAVDGNAGQFADLLGEHGRLVETPRPQPRAVERNRQDHVGVGEQLGSCRRHPPPEQRHALMAITIFEALDQIAHGRGIARSRPRPVVDWRIGDCPGRERRLAGIVRQRHAEP